MGNIERSAREVAGDMPRETFEKAVEAAAKAVCAHRSYRMIAAEVLASVNHAGGVAALRESAETLHRVSMDPAHTPHFEDCPAQSCTKARAALNNA